MPDTDPLEQFIANLPPPPSVDEVKGMVSQSAQKYGLDENLLHAVAQRESGYNAAAVSPKGAIGTMQLMPDTAKGLGADPNDPAQNVDAGARYLRQLIDRYNGDTRKALAAYNAGPARVDSGKPLPQETQDYVDAISPHGDGDLDQFIRTLPDHPSPNPSAPSSSPDLDSFISGLPSEPKLQPQPQQQPQSAPDEDDDATGTAAPSTYNPTMGRDANGALTSKWDGEKWVDLYTGKTVGPPAKQEPLNSAAPPRQLTPEILDQRRRQLDAFNQSIQQQGGALNQEKQRLDLLSLPMEPGALQRSLEQQGADLQNRAGRLQSLNTLQTPGIPAPSEIDDFNGDLAHYRAGVDLLNSMPPGPSADARELAEYNAAAQTHNQQASDLQTQGRQFQQDVKTYNDQQAHQQRISQLADQVLTDSLKGGGGGPADAARNLNPQLGFYKANPEIDANRQEISAELQRRAEVPLQTEEKPPLPPGSPVSVYQHASGDYYSGPKGRLYAIPQAQPTEQAASILPKPVQDIADELRGMIGVGPGAVPFQGLDKVAQGVYQLGDVANQVGWHAISGTAATPNENLPRQAAAGAGNVISGGLEIGSVLIPYHAITDPIRTVGTLAAWELASKGTEKGLEAAGVPQEYSELAGQIAGLGAGALSAAGITEAAKLFEPGGRFGPGVHIGSLSDEQVMYGYMAARQAGDQDALEMFGREGMRRQAAYAQDATADAHGHQGPGLGAPSEPISPEEPPAAQPQGPPPPPEPITPEPQAGSQTAQSSPSNPVEKQEEPAAGPAESAAPPPAQENLPAIAKGATYETPQGRYRVEQLAGDRVLFTVTKDGKTTPGIRTSDDFRAMVGLPQGPVSTGAAGPVPTDLNLNRGNVGPASAGPTPFAGQTPNLPGMPGLQPVGEAMPQPEPVPGVAGFLQPTAAPAPPPPGTVNVHGQPVDYSQRSLTQPTGPQPSSGADLDEFIRNLPASPAAPSALPSPSAPAGSSVSSLNPLWSAHQPSLPGFATQPDLSTEGGSQGEPAHEFSSTQVNLPAPVAEQVRSFASTIPDQQLAEDGREDQPHITVKYGLHGEGPAPVQQVLQSEPPITATLGKASVFPGKDGSPDVLKVDVESPDLHRLNSKIADALPHTDTHPTYQPHVTVAYLKPGEGAQYEGKDLPGVTGQQITLNSVAFSSKNGQTTEIPLGQKPESYNGPGQRLEQRDQSSAAAATAPAAGRTGEDVASGNGGPSDQGDAGVGPALRGPSGSVAEGTAAPGLPQPTQEVTAPSPQETPAAVQAPTPAKKPLTPKQQADFTYNQKIITANSGQPVQTKVLGTVPRPLPEVHLKRLKGKPDYSVAAAEKLVGGLYESYGRGIDQIMAVEKGPDNRAIYRVRDVMEKGAPERRHMTPVDPRGVTFPQGMEPQGDGSAAADTSTGLARPWTASRSTKASLRSGTPSIRLVRPKPGDPLVIIGNPLTTELLNLLSSRLGDDRKLLGSYMTYGELFRMRDEASAVLREKGHAPELKRAISSILGTLSSIRARPTGVIYATDDGNLDAFVRHEMAHHWQSKLGDADTIGNHIDSARFVKTEMASKAARGLRNSYGKNYATDPEELAAEIGAHLEEGPTGWENMELTPQEADHLAHEYSTALREKHGDKAFFRKRFPNILEMAKRHEQTQRQAGDQGINRQGRPYRNLVQRRDAGLLDRGTPQEVGAVGEGGGGGGKSHAGWPTQNSAQGFNRGIEAGGTAAQESAPQQVAPPKPSTLDRPAFLRAPGPPTQYSQHGPIQFRAHGNAIVVTPAGLRAVAAAWGEPGNLLGVAMNRHQALEVAQVLQGKAKSLAEAIVKAASLPGSGSVVIADGENSLKDVATILRHERWHLTQDQLRGFLNNHLGSREQEFLNLPMARVAAIPLKMMGYATHELAAELGAHLAAGQYQQLGLTRPQWKQLFYTYLQLLKAEHGDKLKEALTSVHPALQEAVRAATESSDTPTTGRPGATEPGGLRQETGRAAARGGPQFARGPTGPDRAEIAYRSTSSPSDLDLNDEGILYTTPDEEYSRYWGPLTKKLTISPKKTLDLTHFAADESVDAKEMKAFLEHHGVKVAEPLAKRLDAADGAEPLQYFGQFGKKLLVEAVKAAGYDSAKINEYQGDTGRRATSTLLFDAKLARENGPTGQVEEWPAWKKFGFEKAVRDYTRYQELKAAADQAWERTEANLSQDRLRRPTFGAALTEAPDIGAYNRGVSAEDARAEAHASWKRQYLKPLEELGRELLDSANSATPRNAAKFTDVDKAAAFLQKRYAPPNRTVQAAKDFLSSDTGTSTVAQAAAEAAQNLAKAKDDVLKLLAPAAREGAAPGAMVIRHRAAEMAQRTARAEQALESARKAFSKMPEADRWAWYDRVENGVTDPDQQLEAIAKLVRGLLAGRRADVQALGTGKLQKFIENYMPHAYKDPQKAGQLIGEYYGKRPMEGSKSFLKARKFETLADGMAAGLEPISDNPMDMVLLKLREMDKYIMAHRVLNDLKAQGLSKFVSVFDERPQGWQNIDDRIGTVYGPPTVNVREAFDAQLMDRLENLAAGLGIRHDRKVSIGGQRLGYTSQGGPIVTKFAGPESVLIHEIGHQLEFKFGLWDRLKNLKYPDREKELRNLADLRYEGDPNVSKAFKKYVREKDEKIANAVAALVYAPERFQEVAPNTWDALRDELWHIPAVRPLFEAKRSMTLGTRTAEVPVGGMVTTGHWAMPEPVARLVNNFLSPGLGNSQLYRLYQQAGNTLNNFQLGFSAFHLGFTSIDAATSGLALGIYEAAHGHPVRGLVDALKSPVEVLGVPLGLAAKGLQRAGVPGAVNAAAPASSFLRGDRLLQEYYKPGTQGAQIADLVQAVILAGGRARMDKLYQVQTTQKMMDAFHRGGWGILSGALRIPFALAEQSVRPILEYIVPRQKLGVFADLAQFELDRMAAGEIPAEQLPSLLARAWDSVDNRLGQLVYDNLFWNKTVKDLLMVSVRSVGWNTGTIREILGGAADARNLYLPSKSPEVSTRLSYLLALPVMVALIGSLVHYLYNGKGPESLADRFQPRTGRPDKSGQPERVNLPSYMKDIIGVEEKGLWRTAKDKIHPLLTLIADELANEDFKHKPIVQPSDPLLKSVQERLMYALRSYESMAQRNMEKEKDRNATPSEYVAPFFGVTPAPAAGNRMMKPAPQPTPFQPVHRQPHPHKPRKAA